MIVDCAAYVRGERVPGTLALDEVAAWLGKPDTFVWLGLRMPDRDEMAYVGECFCLDELDADATVERHDRPVLTVEDGIHWLVLRTARYNDATEEVRLGELSVLFNEQLVVTVRYGQASPLDQVRKQLEGDREWLVQGPAAVATSVIGRVVEDFRPALDGFEKDVVEAEHEVFADTRDFPLARLYHLKRQVLDLALVTDAFRDPLARLVRMTKMMQAPEVLADMHEHIEQLDRLVNRTRTLSDLIDTAVDASMTKVSLQQNEDMRRISAWVAIAAVPTAVAGIYGMNFEHMPELRSEYGYYVVLGVIVVVCVVLHRVFRRTGWL